MLFRRAVVRTFYCILILTNSEFHIFIINYVYLNLLLNLYKYLQKN